MSQVYGSFVLLTFSKTLRVCVFGHVQIYECVSAERVGQKNHRAI